MSNVVITGSTRGSGGLSPKPSSHGDTGSSSQVATQAPSTPPSAPCLSVIPVGSPGSPPT